MSDEVLKPFLRESNNETVKKMVCGLNNLPKIHCTRNIWISTNVEYTMAIYGIKAVIDIDDTLNNLQIV